MVLSTVPLNSIIDFIQPFFNAIAIQAKGTTCLLLVDAELLTQLTWRIGVGFRPYQKWINIRELGMMWKSKYGYLIRCALLLGGIFLPYPGLNASLAG